MKKSKKAEQKPDFDTKVAAQALEKLLVAGYVDKKKLYVQNFLRGIFFSLGSIVGATVVIALILWILSVFDSAPIVGNFIRSVQDSINSR